MENSKCSLRREQNQLSEWKESLRDDDLNVSCAFARAEGGATVPAVECRLVLNGAAGCVALSPCQRETGATKPKMNGLFTPLDFYERQNFSADGQNG
jgi:hypothetical protein